MESHQSVLNRVLSHWAWAVLIIFIIAVLSFSQFDIYTPSLDEFYSLHNAGLSIRGPFSPIEFFDELRRLAPDHMPGYFVFLSLWGNLVSTDAVIARVPGIFAGLLSLTITYRLARDTVAPVAGLFALIIVAGNTHFNFYYDHIRMYSLVVFVSGCILWIYFRMVARPSHISAKYFFAFTVAVAALMSLQALASFVLIFALSLSHLLIVKKSRQWLAVPAAIATALVLLSPAIVSVAASGLNSWKVRTFSHEVIDGIEFVVAHLNVMLNNQPILLLPVLFGLLYAVGKKTIAGGACLLIWCLGLAVMAATFELVQEFGTKHIRYSLSLLPPFALIMASGLYALFRVPYWTIILLCVYLIAGISFQRNYEWRQYLSYGRIASFIRQPIHTISRMAQEEEPRPLVLTYADSNHKLEWDAERKYGYSDGYYFFTRHGLSISRIIEDLNSMTFDAVTEPSVWVTYQTSNATPDMKPIISFMYQRHYQLCRTDNLHVDTVVLRFRWQTQDCDSVPEPLASGETDVITYQFYGATVSTDREELLLSDRWQGKVDIPHEDYNISYQLVSSDWNKVAQLDLRLWSQDRLRQYYIDISFLLPGTYRLVAIVYHKETGKSLLWQDNPSFVPEMLPLAELEIPLTILD